jgi:LacI family transcriptional regulator
MPRQLPTISDVATLAGVSRATVSRVLNSSIRVSETTRRTVQDAVNLLRFKPNAQARLLAGGRSHTVILVYPLTDHHPLTWYNLMLESGALRGCGRHGLQLEMNLVYPDPPHSHERVLRPIDTLNCDGIILAPPFSDDPALIALIQARQMPLVCIAPGPATRPLSPGIGMDEHAAGFELAQYLLSLGHQRFAFISGPRTHHAANERFDGFCRATTAAGVAASDIMALRGQFDFDSGRDCFHAVLASGFQPTALVCANDEMAAGALHGAHEVKMAVPGDISIAGFDDAPFASLLSPPLTTIAQPVHAMAQKAADIVVAAIKGEQLPYELTRPRLVIRSSVGPAKVG